MPSVSSASGHDFGRIAVERPIQAKPTPNRTGLPDALKGGVERLSGLSMDDVRVRYGSPEPARVNALAYTQGSDIHVAPGQERQLAHEAWHVVQQKQRRVAPTVRVAGRAVNDDAALEREAETMGARAAGGAAGQTTVQAPEFRNSAPSFKSEPPLQLNGDDKKKGSRGRSKSKGKMIEEENDVDSVPMTNSGGDTIDVHPDKIITALHKLMIDTVIKDRTPFPPYPDYTGQLTKPEGGLQRNVENIDDAYNLVREMKQTYTGLYTMKHGGDAATQIGTNVNANATHGDSTAVQDVMVRPFHIPTNFEGHRYSQIGKSMGHMAADFERKAREIASLHIKMMKGMNSNQLQAEGLGDNDRRARMWYNNAIMFVAEGERNVGMLPFSYIALHNLKHNPRSTRLKDAFGKDMGSAATDEPGTHPAAFSGSKSGLEAIEHGIRANKEPEAILKELKGAARTNANKVLKRMRTGVRDFFRDQRATTKDNKYSNFASANFNDAKGAAQAATDIIRHKFLKRIRQIGEPEQKRPQKNNLNDKQNLRGKVTKNAKKVDTDSNVNLASKKIVKFRANQ